jgi:hypothetical protein
MALRLCEKNKSTIPINTDKKAIADRTIIVELTNSLFDDQVTLDISTLISPINLPTFANMSAFAFPINPLLNYPGLEGLEPPTGGFGDRCSTNWSYRPNFLSDRL